MPPRFELHADTQSLALWADILVSEVPASGDYSEDVSKRMHPVLRLSADHKREITWMREGLIPSYACDDHDADRRTEAHAEAMTCDSCFRGAFRRRRCIVPAQILHETRHLAPGVVHPCSFSPTSGGIFGIAAVWETWINDQGHAVQSFAIITVAVTPLLRSFFQRMPIILDGRQEQDRWLSANALDVGPIDLLKPLSPRQLCEWDMSPSDVELQNVAESLVSSPAINDASGADGGRVQAL